MPFTRPTLQEIVTRVEQDLVTRLQLTGPVTRRSVVAVLARVVAGAVHGLYGFLVFLSQQLFPDTSVTNYLMRQAELYGIQRAAATYATGTVVATGVNGSLIPAGTVLARADGTTYTTQANELIYEDEADLAVIADAAGVNGNADAGTVLTLVSPIGGVNSNTTVDADGLISGADAETDADVRIAVKDILQNPVQGGAADDYVKWAKLRPGVSRVWVYPLELAVNGVTVRFVRDADGSGAAIIPDGSEVTAVQAIIDGLRPLTADVTVVAPIAAAIAFTIHLANDSADARAAVEAELTDLIARTGEPGGTLLLSAIRTAIGVAVGDEDFTLTVPAADVTNATGRLPLMGTVTWA